MYIPSWIIVLAIVAGIYFYLRSNKRHGISTNEQSTVEQMWQNAEFNKEEVMKKSPISGLEEVGTFNDDREMIIAMEADAIRLRERFKHNPEKQKQIAQDWMDYAKALLDVKFAKEMLDVDWEDGAYGRFGESTKESFAIIREVAKRVEEELGKESQLKAVHDRLHKQAEVADEVLAESTKKSR